MDNEIRVVIADDQEGMRLILRKMIEKAEGFTLCAEADNGKDVLDLVEKHKPHVCFLDVEMPGMTGLECAKAIQDTDPHTMVVFATAHDDYMAQAFEVYAFDYMVKPFKLERVMKTMERIRQVMRMRCGQRAVVVTMEIRKQLANDFKLLNDTSVKDTDGKDVKCNTKSDNGADCLMHNTMGRKTEFQSCFDKMRSCLRDKTYKLNMQ